jgi:hypothetical protein
MMSLEFTKAAITELSARIEARELAPGMRRWRAARPMGSAVPADWRRSKARRTATEPSPMAPAMRLTEPLRTSPTGNMPSLLVSRNNGVRFSSSSWAAGISLPVRRKTVPALGQLARQPPRWPDRGAALVGGAVDSDLGQGLDVGRTCVVTGCGRGIGRVLVKRRARDPEKT